MNSSFSFWFHPTWGKTDTLQRLAGQKQNVHSYKSKEMLEWQKQNGQKLVWEKQKFPHCFRSPHPATTHK
jgi:hypothetical protein